MSSAAAAGRTGHVSDTYRWLQMGIGIVCMVMIANLQYGWAFFVPPMMAKFGWSGAALGFAFTLFITVETWLVPFEGWLIEKYGLGLMIFAGGVLSGGGWIINAFAGSLPALYVGQIVAGLGAGIVYGGCVGNAVKWFPDHRGLASGLTAAGFGLGSALTIIPISSMIQNPVYEFNTTFLAFGAGQGLIVILLSLVLRAPRAGDVAIPTNLKVQQNRTDQTPGQVVRVPAFWIMYVMFILVGVGGLMATADLALYSNQLGITKSPVTLFGLTLGALVFAKMLDNITNGITRPICGWISDHIGRENTMFFAFLLEGIGILVLWKYASNPLAFVLLTGVVFFGWGQIYSLFPSLTGDLFGRKHATVNYGLLYTAKGVAAIGVPLASLVHDHTGNWSAVLIVAAVFNFIAAGMALYPLKPMRIKYLASR